MKGQKSYSRGRTPAKQPVRKRGRGVEPVAARRLQELMRGEDAAHLMGTTTTTMYRGLKTNNITPSLETAAKYWLQAIAAGQIPEGVVLSDQAARELRQPVATPDELMDERIVEIEKDVAPQRRRATPETTMFLIEVPADKAAVVRKMVEMAHGKLLEP